MAALMVLQGCGGSSNSSSGNAQLRVINATRTHATLDLIANVSTATTTATTTKQVSGVALGAVSAYSAIRPLPTLFN